MTSRSVGNFKARRRARRGQGLETILNTLITEVRCRPNGYEPIYWGGEFSS